MKLDTNNHSVFLMYYHLILVIKYRKKVLDKFFPSSKRCSCCHEVKQDLKLSDREYHCEVCGLSIDRDYNASLNIKEEGKRLVFA